MACSHSSARGTAPAAAAVAASSRRMGSASHRRNPRSCLTCSRRPRCPKFETCRTPRSTFSQGHTGAKKTAVMMTGQWPPRPRAGSPHHLPHQAQESPQGGRVGSCLWPKGRGSQMEQRAAHRDSSPGGRRMRLGCFGDSAQASKAYGLGSERRGSAVIVCDGDPDDVPCKPFVLLHFLFAAVHQE